MEDTSDPVLHRFNDFFSPGIGFIWQTGSKVWE